MAINGLNIENYEIIREKKVTLEYSRDDLKNDFKEKYIIIIQLCSDDCILINARKEQISDFFYEARMNMDDFKKLNSKLLKLCESIQDIYTFLSDSFDDNKFIIKKITPSKFKLETTVQFTRSVSYSMELHLNKKKNETDDTVKMLCEIITKMETENKNLIQKFENIDFNKNNKVPEFYLNKFSMIINTNSYYYKTPDNNWKYTTSEINISGLYVIISLNMENNIIILCGNKVPPNSYYVNLYDYDEYYDERCGEGIYYNNKYICPFKNSQYSNIISLFGKLKV